MWTVGEGSVATAGRFHPKLQRDVHAVCRACSTQPRATPRHRQGRPGPPAQDSPRFSARTSVAGREEARRHRCRPLRLSPATAPASSLPGLRGTALWACPLAGWAALTVCIPARTPSLHSSQPSPPAVSPGSPQAWVSSSCRHSRVCPTPPLTDHTHTDTQQGSRDA